MSAFDDDPEYEAQLKEVLGDEPFLDGDEEMGDFHEGQIRQDDERSEDGVLDDAPTFRIKVPVNSESIDTVNQEEQLSIVEQENGPALSEDARSISTGDDSPSIQVRIANFVS